MAEIASDNQATPPPLPLALAGEARPVLERCERCQADVSELPATAHFCPRCGRARDGTSVGAAVCATVKAQVDSECEVVAASGTSGHEVRVVHWGQPPPLPPLAKVFEPVGPGERIHSVMLTGYASALHTLGNRYEAGCGVHRNEREAVRCYVKAARLGNEDAADRLAYRGIAAGPTTSGHE